MTENFIPVMFDGGKSGKMVNIFFGDVQIELKNGEKIWVPESRLDQDWRKS
jgi:hypothetical protein